MKPAVVWANIEFPTRDPHLIGDPQEALADTLDLLLRLQPRMIDFRLLATPAGSTIELGADFGAEAGAKPEMLKTILVRSEGETGFQVSFAAASRPAPEWMAATPGLDHPALPSGEPFGLPLPIDAQLPATVRRLKLGDVPFGYRLAARREEGSASLARRLAPGLAACELRGGAGLALASALRETMAVVRDEGWHVRESLCLRKDASDSAAELIESQTVAAIRRLYPFIPESVLGIEWTELEDDPHPPTETGWQEAIEKRRDRDYPARALAAALAEVRAERPSARPSPIVVPEPPLPVPESPYAFLSYAHRDRSQLADLIGGLDRHGLPLWFDDHIDGGVAWDECLEDRIRGCAILIACVSPAYEASRYCRREIKFADVIGKPILPVAAGDYLWGPGLALMFNELQIVRRQAPDWAASVAAHARRLLSLRAGHA